MKKLMRSFKSQLDTMVGQQEQFQDRNDDWMDNSNFQACFNNGEHNGEWIVTLGTVFEISYFMGFSKYKANFVFNWVYNGIICRFRKTF